MLDFRRLQYLDAVYRYRNFTRASEELFVSQSTISTAIKSLEEDLGVRLIVRTPKEVIFTYEGEQFLLCARKILQDCQEAEARMADLSETKNQVLHLGVSPTLGLKLQMFLHSPEFAKKWPKATIYLDEGSMNNHIEKLRQGALDLSYNALPAPDPASQLKLIPTSTAEIYATMLPSHPLAVFEKIDLHQLSDTDIILLDAKSCIQGQIMEEFQRLGILPRIRSTHEQIFCMLNMVKLGNFVGFLNASDPIMRQYLTDIGLIIRPLDPPVTFATGFIVNTSRHLPKLAEELIRFTRRLEAEEAAQKAR